MVDKKISELNPVTVIQTGDKIPLLRSGDADPNRIVDDAVLAEYIRDTMAAALVAGANVTLSVNDGSNTITIGSSGTGGGGSVPRRHPGYKSGRWYRPPYAASNGALPTSNIVAYPWAFPDTITITDLSIYVVTNIAGANVKVGIYSHDEATKGPGEKLTEATISPSASAASASVTLGSPLTLTPGMYWIVVVTDQAITTVNTTATDASLGAMLGTVNSQTVRIENAISYGGNYAGGLPANVSGQSWSPAQIAAPAVALKAA